MTFRSSLSDAAVPTTLPSGSATLPDGSSLSVRGSAKRLDGSAFTPGEYLVDMDVRKLPQVAPGGAPTIPLVERGFPIKLRIVELTSRERQYEFHIIEGQFYKARDSNRAVDHYMALAALPGAQWSDSLPLAWLYADLGRHREACVVLRRILPDLIRHDDPSADVIRERYAGGEMLIRAAMSFAVEGDVATATKLLRVAGRTPQDQIPAEIERLRKSAPKPVATPKH